MILTDAYLEQLLTSQQIPSALLFAGTQGLQLEIKALGFARQLIGLTPTSTDPHPDLFIYRPEGKLGLIPMEAMRNLRDEVYLPPIPRSIKPLLS